MVIYFISGRYEIDKLNNNDYPENENLKYDTNRRFYLDFNLCK